MITTLIIGFVVLTVGGLMSGLLRDWHIQESLARVQEESRPVMREMLVQIRQSTPRGSGNGDNPVTELSWNTLRFYSDRLGDSDDAPEEHLYELVNCSNGAAGGLCDLQLTITEPDDPGLISDWTYTGAPLRVETLLENILAEPPLDLDSDPAAWTAAEVEESLFYMVRWDPVPNSDPIRTIVGGCEDGTAAPCDGNLVVISMLIDPSVVKQYPSIFELYEEVRLRNA
jgi:hypothetical protein